MAEIYKVHRGDWLNWTRRTVSRKGRRKMNHEIIKDNKIPKQVEGQHVGVPRVNGRLDPLIKDRPQDVVVSGLDSMAQIRRSWFKYPIRISTFPEPVIHSRHLQSGQSVDLSDISQVFKVSDILAYLEQITASELQAHGIIWMLYLRLRIQHRTSMSEMLRGMIL